MADERKPVKPNMEHKPVRPNLENKPVRPNPVRPKPQENVQKPKEVQVDTDSVGFDDFSDLEDTEEVVSASDTKVNKTVKKPVKASDDLAKEPVKKVAKPDAKGEKAKNKKVKAEKPSKKTNVNSEDTDENVKVKKKGKGKTILITLAIILLVVIAAVVLLKVLGGNKQTLNFSTGIPATTPEYLVDIDPNAGATVEYFKTENTTEKTTKDKIIIPISVTAKIEDDEEYRDYFSYIDFKLKDVTLGYDEVAKAVELFNKDNNNKVNIGTVEEFYEANKDNELAMFTVELSIPADFPTQDERNKQVFIEPVTDLVMIGAEEDATITTDKFVYDTPTLTNITKKTEEYKVGGTYQFNWITALPLDVTKDTYKLKLTCGNNGDSTDYIFKGFDIAANRPEGFEVSTEEVTEDDTEDATEDSTEEETTEDETEETTEEVESTEEETEEATTEISTTEVETEEATTEVVEKPKKK